MEVKKIVEGMTAVEVAEVIDSNFKNQNKILEDDIATQNSVSGVSEYKNFSEAEAVAVGDVRKYNGYLYECVEATTGAWDASKWKKSSFKAETEKKLSELGSKASFASVVSRGYINIDNQNKTLELTQTLYYSSNVSQNQAQSLAPRTYTFDELGDPTGMSNFIRLIIEEGILKFVNVSYDISHSFVIAGLYQNNQSGTIVRITNSSIEIRIDGIKSFADYLVNPFSVTDTRINKNGDEVVDKNFISTPFIVIDKEQAIIATSVYSATSTSALVFYDKDLRFVSEYDNGSVGEISINVQPSEIPSDAIYMRLCCSPTYGSGTHNLKNGIMDISRVVDSFEKEIQSIHRILDSMRDDDIQYGSVISRGYINIDNAKHEINLSSLMFYWKDGSKNISSGSFAIEGLTNMNNYTRLVVDDADRKIKIVDASKWLDSYVYIASLMIDNEKDIVVDVVHSVIEVKVDDVQKYQNFNVDAFSLSDTILKKNGEIGIDYNFRSTPYIVIDKSKPIIAKNVFDATSASALNFYDKDFNFISSYFSGNGGGQVSMSINPENIPSNAVYIRLGYSVTYNTELPSFSNGNYTISRIVDSASKYISHIIDSNNKLKEKYIKYDSIISRGYINIDNEKNEIYSSALIYYWSNGAKNLVSGTFQLQGLTNMSNYVRLVLDIDTQSLKIVDASNNSENFIYIASVINNNESGKIVKVVHSVIDVRVDGVSNETVLSKANEFLEFNKPFLNHKAAVWESSVRMREQYLRSKYFESKEPQKWYGVEWSETSNANNVVGINSEEDDYLHNTLPIQSKMRRCIVKDGVVQYYLNDSNSELKEDGTLANLDGTDGNVMVEIPEFFYRVESFDVNGVRTHRIKISEQGLVGFQYSPQMYTSAYEVTINRNTGYFESVCTTLFERDRTNIAIESESRYVQGNGFSLGIQNTAARVGFTANAAQYRGGTNNQSLDGEISESSKNYSRNQLGIPVSNINRNDCRTFADINSGYMPYHYNTQKTLYILCQVEFKTRNFQSTELGKGASVYPDYNAYESYFNRGSFTGQNGISCLPCGVTNTLGNKSGEVYYLMKNVPVESSGTDEQITYTKWGNVWMPCMSYRGVEHFWGHIYKIADGIDIKMGSRIGYASGYEGDYYYGIYPLTYYYEKNPYRFQYIQETSLGTFEFCPIICTINSLLMGPNGHILPIGASTKDYEYNYCDCVEIVSENTTMYATYNGRIVSGELNGINFIVGNNSIDSKDARPSDGTRIDWIP